MAEQSFLARFPVKQLPDNLIDKKYLLDGKIHLHCFILLKETLANKFSLQRSKTLTV